MTKVRYEIDPHNRLVLKESGKSTRLSRYRTVLDGRFKTDSKNSLIYHAKIPSHTKELQQIKLKGNWSLNKNHDLVFTLNKWGNQVAKNKLTIKGELINVGGDEITFAVISRETAKKRSIYLLKLSGKWKSGKDNGLEFDVQKDKEADTLHFQGSWKLKNNQLTYNYKKYSGSKRKKDEQGLTFCGYWDIKDKYRLSYVMDKPLKSGFDFRASLAAPIRSKGQYGLKYKLGAGLISNEKTNKTIIIFGEWKIKKGIGLIFEVRYGENYLNSIVFGGEMRINKDYSLIVNLTSRENNDLGIRLELSRRFFNDYKGFLRVLMGKEEKAVELGAGFRW
ncbi:MAG: hypothetical protein KJ593_04545 [Candidatus Omnitrophica bacterium]|nr:hypothetical protein [Candidatus Omnitrophota bacterium]